MAERAPQKRKSSHSPESSGSECKEKESPFGILNVEGPDPEAPEGEKEGVLLRFVNDLREAKFAPKGSLQPKPSKKSRPWAKKKRRDSQSSGSDDGGGKPRLVVQSQRTASGQIEYPFKIGLVPPPVKDVEGVSKHKKKSSHSKKSDKATKVVPESRRETEIELSGAAESAPESLETLSKADQHSSEHSGLRSGCLNCLTGVSRCLGRMHLRRRSGSVDDSLPGRRGRRRSSTSYGTTGLDTVRQRRGSKSVTKQESAQYLMDSQGELIV